jgi:hypothetical protein
MADSIRQQLVDEIKRRLAQIQTAAGYETDLGSGPIEEMPVQFQEEEMPALGVLDLIDTVRQDYALEKRVFNELSMQVRIFLQRETSAALTRKMIADVKRALITDPASGERDATCGGLAVDMQPEQDGPDILKDTFQIDAAVVMFFIQFLTQPFNDYE